jgi:hypothetical protein
VNGRLVNSAGLGSVSAGRIVLSVAVYSVSAESAAPAGQGRFFQAHYLVGLDCLFCHRRGGKEH